MSIAFGTEVLYESLSGHLRTLPAIMSGIILLVLFVFPVSYMSRSCWIEDRQPITP